MERVDIAKNITTLVKSCGKSQLQIAVELDIDESTVRNYMTGKALPSVLVVIKLRKVLNCSYEDILG